MNKANKDPLSQLEKMFDVDLSATRVQRERERLVAVVAAQYGMAVVGGTKCVATGEDAVIEFDTDYDADDLVWCARHITYAPLEVTDSGWHLLLEDAIQELREYINPDEEPEDDL